MDNSQSLSFHLGLAVRGMLRSAARGGHVMTARFPALRPILKLIGAVMTSPVFWVLAVAGLAVAAYLSHGEFRNVVKAAAVVTVFLAFCYALHRADESDNPALGLLDQLAGWVRPAVFVILVICTGGLWILFGGAVKRRRLPRDYRRW